MIVVDASLATKWFVGEQEHDVALTFLHRFDRMICAPDLLLSEVAGAIVRRANEDKSFADEAILAVGRLIDAWREGVIVTHRIDAAVMGNASVIAIELGHPLPDCIYLALSLKLECDLGTCDAKFAAKASLHYPNVRLLHEFDLIHE